jgi:acylphosphatase
MSETVRRITIAGLVQGVGFRAFVADAARRHRVRGWVRNRRDRTVEALLVGPSEAVGEVMVACRRGPPGSQVEAVEAFEADEVMLGCPTGAGFLILQTV